MQLIVYFHCSLDIDNVLVLVGLIKIPSTGKDFPFTNILLPYVEACYGVCIGRL